MKDSHLMISLLCIASLSVLCGCTHNELSEEGDGATAPLCVCQAWTGGLVTATRAEGESERKTLGKDSEIGLFLEKAGDYTSSIINQQYNYGSPNWKPADEKKPLQLNKEQANLAAYYPYKEGVTAEKVLTFVENYSKPVDPQTEDPAEFYYKNFKASIFNPSVSLDLRRAYSRLRFSFTKDDHYSGDEKVTLFSWSVEGFVTAGTLNLFDGNVTATSTEMKKYTAPTITSVGTMEKPAIIEYLVVPSTSTSKFIPITVNVTAGGKKKTVKIAPADLCGTAEKIEEGMLYEIRITLRPGKLSVQTITVRPWDDPIIVNPDPGDELENK